MGLPNMQAAMKPVPKSRKLNDPRNHSDIGGVDSSKKVLGESVQTVQQGLHMDNSPEYES